MNTTTVTFRVPSDISRGLAAGQYHLFGGVVRDNAGRVVNMLDPIARNAGEAAKRNPKGALIAVATLVVVGGGIMLYKGMTRRARLLKPLELVDEKVRNRFSSETVTMKREELLSIRSLLSRFLDLTNDSRFRSIELRVSPEQLNGLRSFAEILTTVSKQIRENADSAEAIPEGEMPDNLVDLVQYMTRQIDYQNRNWPDAV